MSITESSVVSSKASSNGDSAFDPVAYAEHISKTVGPNFHEDDPLFQTDEFRMHCYKVLPCAKRFCHDWSVCPFAHFSERAKRRDSKDVKYTAIACPDMKKGEECPRGDKCPYSHNTFEYWLHPTRYRTRLCRDGEGCNRKICFFAHKPDEVRVPSSRPSLPVTDEQWPFNDEFGKSGELTCDPGTGRSISAEFGGDLEPGFSPSTLPFDTSNFAAAATGLPQNISDMFGNIQNTTNQNEQLNYLANLNRIASMESATLPTSMSNCTSNSTYHVPSSVGTTYVDKMLESLSTPPSVLPMTAAMPKQFPLAQQQQQQQQMQISAHYNPSNNFNLNNNNNFFSPTSANPLNGVNSCLDPLQSNLALQNLLNSLYLPCNSSNNTAVNNPLAPLNNGSQQQQYNMANLTPVTTSAAIETTSQINSDYVAALLSKIQLGNNMMPMMGEYGQGNAAIVGGGGGGGGGSTNSIDINNLLALNEATKISL